MGVHQRTVKRMIITHVIVEQERTEYEAKDGESNLSGVSSPIETLIEKPYMEEKKSQPPVENKEVNAKP